jgi:23S rRNA (adenine2503-C2)-methyltransferase
VKDSILNYTQEELAKRFDKPFRAKQIFNAVYQKYVNSFEEITTLPKSLRASLNDSFIINSFETLKVQVSIDKSKKYLFKLQDGHTIETVLLLMKEEQIKDGKKVKEPQYTVCISTQVGCKIGCAFCLTGQQGFVRNLEPFEIVEQVLQIKKDNNFPPQKRLNIVYMGMGEPLDNFYNTIKAIKILSDIDGIGIAPRRQTISTSGISPKIKELGKLNLDIGLAISLHAVSNDIRQKLIPLNKAYPIESIIEAVKAFPMKKRRRVLFEYLVIKGVNDDIHSAKKLVKLLSNIKAKVNLIYFNPFENSSFQRPSIEDMKRFQKYLLDKGLFATIRQSRGIDISAACGQLKEQNKV